MKRDFNEVKLFLRDNIKVVVIVTIAAFGLGYMGYGWYASNAEFAGLMDKMMDQVASGLEGEEGISLCIGIFLNNLKAATYAVVMGIIPFIFIPFFNIATNGLVTGAVISSASIVSGKSAAELFVLGILPHGIFEIPALVISISLGIVLCREVSKGLLRKPHLKLGILIEKIAKTFVLLVLPLLVVAALVESFITPMLMQ